jgi:hypothetical protein
MLPLGNPRRFVLIYDNFVDQCTIQSQAREKKGVEIFDLNGAQFIISKDSTSVLF